VSGSYPPDHPDRGTWPQYERLVLESLDRLEAVNTEQRDKLNKLEVDLAILQTKAALVSAGIAAAVSAIIAWIVKGH
jgi:hypothetical protein